MTEIPVFRTFIPHHARTRAAEVMARGWLGYGPECRALEARFTRDRGGAALATSSCTSALYLAALAARRGPAPEVIVPSVTFISSAMAFRHAGYRVRVAPVDSRHLMLTPETVLPLITDATVAVVAVHLYGQRCPDSSALRRLCDRHGLLLIEDCAHRLDLLDPAPPKGHFACYSFNAVKEVPCGEGGLLWSADPACDDLVRSLSNVGLGLDTMQRAATTQHADYTFRGESGLKLRGNDLAASLVNAGLECLPDWRARRQAQFATYDRLAAPLHPEVHLLARGTDDACLMYVVRVAPQRRETIRQSMAYHGVATSVHYPSLAHHPHLGDAPDRDGVYRREVDDSLVTLPTFLEMTDGEQTRVIEALGAALASCSATSAAGANANPLVATA
ncbi:MAG: DegT/DnrJ/EryC1/StrS aminotransferase family protein [Casimicrobiaceae bacterium]